MRFTGPPATASLPDESIEAPIAPVFINTLLLIMYAFFYVKLSCLCVRFTFDLLPVGVLHIYAVIAVFKMILS